MTAYEEDPPDASTIASLHTEGHAAREEWREGEPPPLTTRLDLRAESRHDLGALR